MNDTNNTSSKINNGQGIVIPAQAIGESPFRLPLIYDGRRAHLVLTYTESESGFSFSFDSVEMGGESRSLTVDWSDAGVPGATMDSKSELKELILPAEVVQVIERQLDDMDRTQFGGRAHRESLE